MRIIIDNVTSEVSSGLKVDPETWDHDNDIMEYTHNVRKRLIQVHNTFLKENAIITSQRVKDAYLTKYVDVHTHVGEVKQLIERNRVEVKIGNRSKDTVLKSTVFLRHLTEFLATKRLSDITFDQVNVSFLQELETFIKQKGNAHNTTKKHMDILRKLFRYAQAKKWTDQDPFYFYKITEQPVKKEPLDEADIELLLQNRFVNQVEKVRDVFIIQCFTGMSYSDIEQFTRKSTYKDAAGSVWIDNSRVKTGVDYSHR